MTREEAIEKVQKLLALANGTDKEGEMKNAMKLAQAFLRKHNLEMSDCELQEELDDMITNSAPEFARTYQWVWYISDAIDNICCTQHFRSQSMYYNKKHDKYQKGHQMHFCGTKTDVTTALEIFKFLYETIQAMGKAAKYPVMRERCAYCNGIGYKIYLRAKELKQEDELDQIDGERCKAIMIVKEKEVAKYVEEKHNIKIAKMNFGVKDQSAFAHGMADGSNVPLSANLGLEG